MRNDSGLGDRACRGEGAPAVNNIPAGGRERTRLLVSAVLAVLERAIGVISSRASLLLFHNGDKPLQCTHFARLASSGQGESRLCWKHFPHP